MQQDEANFFHKGTEIWILIVVLTVYLIHRSEHLSWPKRIMNALVAAGLAVALGDALGDRIGSDVWATMLIMLIGQTFLDAFVSAFTEGDFLKSTIRQWARKLEKAGCHVVYGLVGLKTHCKLALVVRDEPEGLRRYAHIGTGNYNPKTARLYEDFGLLTSDPSITGDLTRLFNNLSGYAQDLSYDRLMVAPSGLRAGLVERIEHEIEHHRAGRPAHIRIKVNSIVDEVVVDKLYEASRAGVPVDLVVRGICTLRPGVPGLSENVRVTSVLGRFLEHSRVYCFTNGGDPEAWIGSADLMHRNLDRRVEVLVKVPDTEHVAALGDLLAVMSDDDTRSWRLAPDGAWHRNEGTLDVQEMLIKKARERRSR